MNKMKFLGLLLAFSFMFLPPGRAQMKVTRIIGSAFDPAIVTLCSNTICLTPWNYPIAGISHTFELPASEIFYITVAYPTGNFSVLRSMVDTTLGFYTLSNGLNTLFIQKFTTDMYEFFIM